MDKLEIQIKPILEQIDKHHNRAREEQVLGQVYAELKAKGVTVGTTLPRQEFDDSVEHQIESLAYCMDMQQAHAICEDTFMHIIPQMDLKLTNQKVEAPVTREQVKRCLVRIEKSEAEALVLANGCRYRKERWGILETKKRWREFRKRVPELGAFSPWNTLTSEDLERAAVIPNKRDFVGKRVQGIRKRKPSHKKNPVAKPAAPIAAPNHFAAFLDSVQERKPLVAEPAPMAVEPVPVVAEPVPLVEPEPVVEVPEMVGVEFEAPQLRQPVVQKPESSPLNARRSRSRSFEP